MEQPKISQSVLIQLSQILLFDETISFGFVSTAFWLQLNMTRLLTMMTRTENKYRDTSCVSLCTTVGRPSGALWQTTRPLKWKRSFIKKYPNKHAKHEACLIHTKRKCMKYIYITIPTEKQCTAAYESEGYCLLGCDAVPSVASNITDHRNTQIQCGPFPAWLWSDGMNFSQRFVVRRVTGRFDSRW